MNALTNPAAEPPQVEIDITEPVPTDAEVEKMFKEELALARIGPGKVRLFKRLGVHLEGQGVIRTQRGSAFVSQTILSDAMSICHRLLTQKADFSSDAEAKKIDIEEVCALTQSITAAAKALTESQEFMVNLDGARSIRSLDSTPPRSTFPAGAIVAGGNAQVHVHNEPQKPA